MAQIMEKPAIKRVGEKRVGAKPGLPRGADRDASPEKKVAAAAIGVEAEFPPEGPHARAHLINEAATPGAGLFSNTGGQAGKDVDPGAG